MSRDPGDPGAGRRPGPVRRGERRRRGAHRVPGGRRRRRHRPAVRRPRAGGPGRGPAAPLPAVQGPVADRVERRPDAQPGQAHGRRVQPEGRRRDDDRRRQRRRRGGAEAARSGRPRRPRPPVRRRSRRTSTCEPQADPRRRHPRRGRACASRSSCGRTRCATTVASTCWRPRSTPEAAELITPDHVVHILGTLLEGYDAGRRRCRLDRSTSACCNVFEAAETIILPVYPEIAALKSVHALLDYLNEAGTDRGQVDVRAQQHVRPRHPQAARHRGGPRARRSRSTCRTTRSCTSRR